MAGLLERMGLVRSEYEDVPTMPIVPMPEMPSYEEEVPTIDASQVSYEDVIRSIYEQGNVSDEDSIFKIKAYIDILPAEMTNAKKQASISGILTVNGINVVDLINDGQHRIRVLEGAEADIKADNDEVIAQAEADIEHLKSLIEEAEAKIAEAKKKTGEASAAIKSEVEAISQLLEFADGIADKEGEQ